MSKKSELARLSVYLVDGDQPYQSLSIAATRTRNTRGEGFELYVVRHHGLMGGRDSFHASGARTLRTELVQREERVYSRRLSEIDKVMPLTGFCIGHSRNLQTGEPSFRLANPQADTGNRISTRVAYPERPHGYELFAVPPVLDGFLDVLNATPPYPGTTIANVLVSRAVDPWIVLVTWVAGDDDPYTVEEFENVTTGAKKLSAYPRAYGGVIFPDTPSDLVYGPNRGPWSKVRDIPAVAYFCQT